MPAAAFQAGSNVRVFSKSVMFKEISGDQKPVPRLKEGENDPESDRIVQDLIFWSPEFTVYVDDRQNVEWYYEEQANFPDDSAQVLAEIAHVKVLSSHLDGSSRLRPVLYVACWQNQWRNSTMRKTPLWRVQLSRVQLSREQRNISWPDPLR